MQIVIISGVVAVAGLLVHAFAEGKAAIAGLYAFAVGLLAFLLHLGAHPIKF